MDGHEDEATSLLCLCGFRVSVNPSGTSDSEKKMKRIKRFELRGDEMKKERGLGINYDTDVKINTAIKHNFQHFNLSMKCYGAKRGLCGCCVETEVKCCGCKFLDLLVHEAF